MCISIVPIFNHLDTAEMNEIVKTDEFGKRIHEVIRFIMQVRRSDGLYIVHKGRVKIYQVIGKWKRAISYGF